jgi:hypothetical protein
VVELPFSLERHFAGMQIQWVTRAIPPIRDFCHRLLGRATPRLSLRHVGPRQTRAAAGPPDTSQTKRGRNTRRDC